MKKWEGSSSDLCAILHAEEQHKTSKISNSAAHQKTLQYTHHTVSHYTTRKESSSVQYRTVQYSTLQYKIVHYNTVQYNTEQYSKVQYSTVLVDDNRECQYGSQMLHKIQKDTI